MVNEIKAKLQKRKIDIKSNQCLLFIYMMEKNGLDLTVYKQKDLEALYMFFKAEIATSSLNLQGLEGEEYTNKLKDSIVPENENYDENDFSDDVVYGTVNIERATYNGQGENGKPITSRLKYMPYEEFKNLIQSKNINEAIKYFTLDEEDNLIVACWSTSSITYTFEGIDSLPEERRQEIAESYEDDSTTNVYEYRKIPYQKYIYKYTMPFSFGASLVAITDNPQFCKDIAKIAEESHITLTLQEQYSETNTTTVIDGTQTDKIYAKLNAKCTGNIAEEVNDAQVIRSNERVDSVQAILNQYHWNEGFDKNTQILQGSSNGGRMKYTWKWEGRNTTYSYTLIYKSDRSGVTIEELSYTSSSNLVTQTTRNKNNLFITKNGKLQEGGFPSEVQNLPSQIEQEEFDIQKLKDLSAYTKKVDSTYKITGNAISKSNSYKLEITSVDNWYEYYQKSYTEIKSEDIGTGHTEATTSLTPAYVTSIKTENFENLDYVQNITEGEKRRIARDILEEHLDDVVLNPELEITELQEDIYTYGEEKISINNSGIKYTLGNKVLEQVYIKVQPGNELSNLIIAADENKIKQKKEGEEEQDSKVELTEIYRGLRADENGFLRVYDKYDDVQKTFNSIEDWSYEMLDLRKSTVNITDLLRYLLFLYDGTDFGVTDYDLTLFKPDEFKSALVNGSAISEWLKSYENNSLREFRNGQITYDEYSQTLYGDMAGYDDEGNVVYYLDRLDVENEETVDHSWNFSYGIMVYTMVYPENRVVLAPQYLEMLGMTKETMQNYIETQIPAGAHISEKGWDADTLDSIHDMIIDEKRQYLKAYYEEQGITLENNELDAFIAIAYAFGNCDGTESSIEVLRRYKAGEATKEELIEKFDIPNAGGTLSQPFMYTSWGRHDQLLAMFFEGRYILSTGEEIDPNSFLGGSLLQAAEILHKRMEDEKWMYYTDTSEILYYNDIESSTNKTKATCCATYVISSIYLSELATEEEINSLSEGYNNCGGVVQLLEKKGWEKINSKEELEAGDVVLFSYPDTTYQYDHVEIYAGNSTWYGAGSTSAIQRDAPSSWSNNYLMANFSCAYRHIGN